VSSSALSVGPLALIFGAGIYVLKRWWDNADTLIEHRRDAYSDYYVAAYTLGKDIMHNIEDGDASAIVASYELFQTASPKFLLHASPTAMVISDEFYDRCMKLRLADRSSWTDEERNGLVSELSNSLSVLRETMKSDLYIMQPRFLIERLNFKRKWRKYGQDNTK